jgi:hypothetical protein
VLRRSSGGAEQALFDRVSNYRLGPCDHRGDALTKGLVAALTCYPGSRGVDSIVVRQFQPTPAADADADDRPSEQGQILPQLACGASSDPEITNPEYKPAKGVWRFHQEDVGKIACYPEPKFHNRVLLWTYSADGVEMALFRTDDDSDQAARVLLDWWETNIHKVGLLRPVG